MTDKMIAALLQEREGYQRRGLKDRVALVDAQLKQIGYQSKSDAVEVAAVDYQTENAAAPKVRKKKV